MIRKLTLCFFSMLLTVSGLVNAQVLINEFDADQVSNDTQEFIELYDGGIGNTDLTGLIVVLYSGATDTSYMTIDLAGYTTDASGFFTIGSTGMGSPIEIPPGGLGWLQNGPDAITVYNDLAANFPIGTAVTDSNLVDAVVYSNDAVQAPNLISMLLLPGEFQLDENSVGYGTTVSLGRCPDGAGAARTTATFMIGLPSNTASNDCAFVTPTPVPTSTPTATPTMPPAPPCDDEYLVNGDMESWTMSGAGGPPDSWYLNASPAITFTAEQETSILYQGTASTRLFKTAGGIYDSGAIYQAVPVQVLPDTVYTLSVQVFDDDVRGYAQAYIQWRTITGAYIYNSINSNSSVDSTDWQLLTLSELSPTNAGTARVYIRVFDIDETDVELYVDDVTLTAPCDPIPTPTPTLTPTQTSTPTQAPCDENFLPNAGFEDWDGFTLQNWFGETGVQIQPEAIEVHEGIYAADVSRTMSGIDLTSEYVPIVGGELYEGGIWLIDNDPDVSARFYVLFYNSEMNWIGSVPWQDTSGENPDYQEKSFTMFLTSLNARWARMRVRFISNEGGDIGTGVTGTITIDDAYLSRMCDASTPTPNPTPTTAPQRTIYNIQYTTDPTGQSPWMNHTVRTWGVVTAVQSGHPDVFIQDGEGIWNGLHITMPAGPGSLQQGDFIVVQGVVQELADMTTLFNPDYVSIQSSGNPLPTPAAVTSDGVNDEAWEGVLVRVSSLTVSNVNAGPGEWEADDATGTLRVDDMYSYTYAPTLGETLDWVQGPISSDSTVFKIQPRNNNDIRVWAEPIPTTGVTGLLILLLAIGGILSRKLFR